MSIVIYTVSAASKLSGDNRVAVVYAVVSIKRVGSVACYFPSDGVLAVVYCLPGVVVEAVDDVWSVYWVGLYELEGLGVPAGCADGLYYYWGVGVVCSYGVYGVLHLCLVCVPVAVEGFVVHFVDYAFACVSLG